MNRKIKFRFWNKKDKYYSNSNELSVTGEGVVLFAGSQLHGRKYEAEQWTGLTDINGVDVYEGDIVRVNYRYDVDVGEVKFLPEQTCFVWYPVGLVGVDEPGVVSYRHLRDGAYGVEVVGNVHSLRNKNIIDEEFL